MDVFIRTIQYAKEKGLVVIGDIKRSDIASTAQAYADGHIGEVAVGEAAYAPYQEDFVTLNPYLGVESVEPYFPHLTKYDKGLFVLVKTSNPGSGEIQDLPVGEAGKPLYEVVGELVESGGSFPRASTAIPISERLWVQRTPSRERGSAQFCPTPFSWYRVTGRRVPRRGIWPAALTGMAWAPL